MIAECPFGALCLRRFSFALATFVVVACGEADEPQPPPQRSFANVEWDTVFAVGGRPQDTLLLRPRLLAARSERVYVYDYIDAQVKAFDRSGALLWRFGRKGGGPGEFRNPVDIEVAPDGAIWLVDSGAGRFTVLSRNGELGQTVIQRTQFVRDVLPLRQETLATPISPEDLAWIAVTSAGDITARGSFPLPELKSAYFGDRGTVAAVSPDGETWAAVFPFGNTLLVYNGRELRCHGRLIEGLPLSTDPPQPQPTVSPTVWAAAVFFGASNRVVVLPRGETELALRMLDEYSAEDCTYVRTIRLPARAVAAAGSGALYIIAFEDPAPGLLGLTAR